MPFTAALSTVADTARAVEEVCTQALGEFAGSPDLALVFFSPHHAENAGEIATSLVRRLAPRHLLGCMGEAIVGNDREIERQPAISLWIGRWTEPVELEPFHLTVEPTAEGYSILGWPDGLMNADLARSAMLLLGDPFTFPADAFLQEVNSDHAGLRVMGGMASGADAPGQGRLLLGERVLEQGAVGVLLQGPLRLWSVVSQGCRPIGRHMIVTRAEENLILELGGKPPLLQLQQLWQELSSRDQELFQQGLHIGLAVSEYRERFGRGDFLVRNVLGLEQQTGALAIAGRARVGQTVQFHVRDAQSADDDLHLMLQVARATHESKPASALLFTCNGRGTRLFSQAHHDAQVVRAEMADIPIAGFFAQGELGPVGTQNFIHGFTASIVLLAD